MIETRRLSARPSGLSAPSALLFGAIAYGSPNPLVEMLASGSLMRVPKNSAAGAPTGVWTILLMAFVIAMRGLRFYAGVPLRGPSGCPSARFACSIPSHASSANRRLIGRNLSDFF
jgi:hypothetical protein